MSVQKKIEDILSQSRADKDNSDKRSKELNQIVQDIREGKQTTGDEIKDFLIAWNGDFEGKYYQQVKDIQNEVAANIGRPLLIMSVMDMRAPNIHIDGAGQNREVPTHLERTFNLSLGVPKSGLSLLVREGKGKVNFDKYAERVTTESYGFMDDDYAEKQRFRPQIPHEETEWKLKEGSIEFHAYRLLNAGEMHWLKLFSGKKIDEVFIHKPQEEWYADKKVGYDLSYISALKMVGMHVSEKFNAANNKFLDERRVNIYHNLDVLVASEASNSATVKETEGRARDLRGVRDENWSNSDSEIYSRWCCATEAVKTLRKDITRNLQEVVKLGLHNTERTIELVPGKTIDFPKYFSAVLASYPLK